MAYNIRTFTVERTMTTTYRIDIEIETSGDDGWDEQEALDKAYEAGFGDWYVVREEIGDEYVVETDTL
jgi:hypothetical protein